ncbi:ABC transporter ATP-binding protein [Nocardioides KLBMP 9356]|uniref:ABC transporter ATP-binding protein n=1 Tax=Nocardioides potassii TaxID=2911371 RepID=A0ABS9HA93_9ACTN|nr:ABC transporter ATP-binding protein [Nocardioides potassii]MCF6378116.1 ABC transporter ATP-binding protein [Nocardioides potassii]
MTGPLVQARDLYMAYGQTAALAGTSVECAAGETLGIVGASGSGKSSLLLCVAGILKPDQGEVWFNNRRIDQLGERERSRLRLTDLGVVFQFGNLVAELTALENVALPLLLQGFGKRQAEKAAGPWLERLGVAHRAGSAPNQMSGGEAQRVALARAFVTEPKAIFADEPTGALDAQTGARVLDALLGVARENGTAVLMATHDLQLARSADRVVSMSDGALVGSR